LNGDTQLLRPQSPDLSAIAGHNQGPSELIIDNSNVLPIRSSLRVDVPSPARAKSME